MPIDVVWFKRDLRTLDHEPLLKAAASENKTHCIFLIEPRRLEQPECSPIHIQRELDCAIELKQKIESLGGSFEISHAEIEDSLIQLDEEYQIENLYSHEETGIEWSYNRDITLHKWCKSRGIKWTEFPSNGVVRVLQNRNTWKRQRDSRMKLELKPAPRKIVGIDRMTEIPSLTEMGIEPRSLTNRQQPGEVAALQCLHSFLYQRGEPYRWAVSSPVKAEEHGSRLAPYLSVGCISVRRAVQNTKNRMNQLKAIKSQGEDVGTWLKSLSSFQSRLAWHCHFIQKLEMEPTLDYKAQNAVIDSRLNRELNEEKLEVWKAGMTGWPFFDACMRQLTSTGWINFRMRAMMMSVASYNLWLPWREVGIHLATLFLDYEPGIHWSQVGMQSGTTGINTVRAYSVTKQGKDHDKNGDYIRKWIPELRMIPTKYIHEPWKMSEEEQTNFGCRIGVDYPAPILDEKESRKEGIKKTYAARKSPKAKEKSRAVYQKHGSRKRPRKKSSKKDNSSNGSRQTTLF